MGATASVCLSSVDDNYDHRVPEDPHSGQTAQQDQTHVEMVSKSENIPKTINFLVKSDPYNDGDSTHDQTESKLDTSPINFSVSDLERAVPTIDVEEFRAKVLDIPETSANEIHPSCVFLQAAEVAKMQELRTRHSKRITFNSSPEDLDSVLVSTPSASLPHTESILSQMQSPNQRRSKNVTSINTMDVPSSILARTGESPPENEIPRVSAQEKLYFDFSDNISEGNASIPESQATTINNGMLGSPFSDNTSLHSLDSNFRIYQAPNLEAGPHILSYYAPNENQSAAVNANHRNEPDENLSEDASPEMEERFFNNLRVLQSDPWDSSHIYQLKMNDKIVDDKFPLQGQYKPPIFQDAAKICLKTESIHLKCDTIDEDKPYEGASSYSISGSNSSSSAKYDSNVDSSVLRIKTSKKMTWTRYMKKATSAALRATFAKKRGSLRRTSV